MRATTSWTASSKPNPLEAAGERGRHAVECCLDQVGVDRSLGEAQRARPDLQDAVDGALRVVRCGDEVHDLRVALVEIREMKDAVDDDGAWLNGVRMTHV